MVSSQASVQACSINGLSAIAAFYPSSSNICKEETERERMMGILFTQVLLDVVVEGTGLQCWCTFWKWWTVLHLVSPITHAWAAKGSICK